MTGVWSAPAGDEGARAEAVSSLAPFGVTHADSAVIDYLRTVAVDGVARVTYREVASGAGCARSTTHRSLARLVAAGWITVDLSSRGGLSIRVNV